MRNVFGEYDIWIFLITSIGRRMELQMSVYYWLELVTAPGSSVLVRRDKCRNLKEMLLN